MRTAGGTHRPNTLWSMVATRTLAACGMMAQLIVGATVLDTAKLQPLKMVTPAGKRLPAVVTLTAPSMFLAACSAGVKIPMARCLTRQTVCLLP
jgi:hypothetical protein